MLGLLQEAKAFIINAIAISQPAQASTSSTPCSVATVEPPAVVGRYKFLASIMRNNLPPPGEPDTPATHLGKYIGEVEGGKCGEASPLVYWSERRSSYPSLTLLAEDLISAPASEAFVQRVFSVAGLLSTGRRNRLCKNLHNRVFLKLNHKFTVL